MSYDNERSVALKAEFAFDAGLAGVINHIIIIVSSFWSSGDDNDDIRR